MTDLDLLRCLADGDGHTAAALATALGVAESDVGDLAARLNEQEISVRGSEQGVLKLHGPLDLLDERAIAQRARDAVARLTRLEIALDPGSTSATLQSRAQTTDIHGHALFAERQSAGRGRLGRPWVSPLARNQYLSIAWTFAGGVESIQGLSLAVGAALADQLEATWQIPVRLKWPNDVYCQERKLGGILINIAGDSTGACTAIVGIGLNVQMPEDAAETIDQPWTDLTTQVGSPVNRSEVAADMLTAIVPLLANYEPGGFKAWRDRWQHRDLLYGEQVHVSGAQTFCGVAGGVNDEGTLLVRTESGVEAVYGGDVTLRRADRS